MRSILMPSRSRSLRIPCPIETGPRSVNRGRAAEADRELGEVVSRLALMRLHLAQSGSPRFLCIEWRFLTERGVRNLAAAVFDC